MPNEALETSSIRSLALEKARDAEPGDLKYVPQGTKIIDVPFIQSVPKHPDWYEKPRMPDTQDGLLGDPHTEAVNLSGIVFNVKGEGNDFYQGITVAEIAYVINKEGQPEIVASDMDGQQSIPLSNTNDNLKLVLELAALKRKEKQALGVGNTDLLNQISKKRDRILDENSEVASIKEDIANGLSLSSTGLKAAGRQK